MKDVYKPLVPIALFLFSLLCYGSVISTYFLSDDFLLIGRVAREGMYFTWGRSHGGFLRPGTVLSYLIDYRIWGLNPIGYHLTNILWHAAAAYALYLVGCVLLREGDNHHIRTLSFLAACLFVALPSHSESVTWIAGRTDVIAVALGLGATAAFLHLLSFASVPASICALLLLSAALLTKEVIIVVLPIWLVLTVHHWWRSKTCPTYRTFITLVLASLILVGYFYLRKATLGHFVGGYGTARHISIWHPLTLVQFARYAVRTFLPALPLRFYGVRFAMVFWGAVLVSCIATLLLFRIGALSTTRWHVLPVLAASYIGSLTPVVTLDIRLFDTQSERFLYLPSAFACLGAVVLADMIFRRRHVTCAVLFFLTVIEGIALQWVNTRWITASHLCKQIAAEVSKHALEDTVVLNIPDNYRGAYVFRSGFQDAATLFAGNNATGSYLIICKHSLDSIHQNIGVDVTTSNLLVTLPGALRFYRVNAGPYEVSVVGQTLFLAAPSGSGAETDTVTFLSFKNGSDRPMLRTIEWRLPNNPRAPAHFEVRP